MTDGQYRHVLPRGAMLGDVKYGRGLRRREVLMEKISVYSVH